MKRTLFITSNRLGDAVLTTGILKRLIEKEPDSKVTVVCGKIPASLFSEIPEVEKVVAISKRKRSLHWWDAFKEIDGFFWHRIVDFRSSALGFLPTRHRHYWRGGADTEHKLVSNARLIGEDDVIMPAIQMQNGLTREALGLPLDCQILALAPTANFYKKQWHYENFIGLAKRLTAPDGILPGAKVLVLGAPGEEAQAMPVVEALPADQVLDFVGKTDPMQAAKLLSHASLFVGNDSGLMHTATAVNIPTVGLFGIGKPTVYRPYGPKSLCLIGDPAGVEITREELTDEQGNVTVRETLPLAHVAAEIEAFYKSLHS